MTKALTIASLSSPQEALFVATLLELGGPQFAGEAALRAGYATTLEDAERAAAFLLGAPRITRAITGEIRARFDVAAVAAVATLLEICTDKSAPSNARVHAAESLLNRSTLGPPLSRTMSVSAHVGVEELLEKLDRAERETIDITPES